MSHKEAHKIKTICLSLFVVLSSVSTAAQVASPSPAPPARTGKITGRVVNEKGQPLPDASIVLRPVSPNMPAQRALTDMDGKFEVSGLDRVNYQMSASLGAYAPLPRDPATAQSSNHRVGDSVTFVLTKGGVITGTVTTQTGEPMAGIHVLAKIIRGGELLPWPYGLQPYGRMTDDRGVYRIYGLPAGTYVVWAGGSTSIPGIDPFDTDVPTYAPASTRDTAAEITVNVGEEVNNVDIRYRGEPGRIVSGTVNGPNADQQMEFGIELTSIRDGESRSTSTMGVRSEDTHGFAFLGVDDGDYYVTARSLVSVGEWAFSVPKRITVRGADVTGLDLVTQPLGAVTGRVVLQESDAPECTDKERPLFSETLISAWHKETRATKAVPRFIWSAGAPVSPDAEGNVTLRNLAPDDYRFVAQFSGKYWYLQSISLSSKTKPVDASRTWTTIKSGERISGLTVTLAQGAASLRGQIAIAEGQAVPERLFVYLVPAERERAEDVLRYFSARVAPDGQIAINNVAPGRYWIAAQPALENLRLPDATETRSILRRTAEATKNEIEFKPCQSVVDYRLKF